MLKELFDQNTVKTVFFKHYYYYYIFIIIICNSFLL